MRSSRASSSTKQARRFRLFRGAAKNLEKLEAAATILRDLDEDVAAIAELRASSLERAMLDGRTWSYRAVPGALREHEAVGTFSHGVYSTQPGPNDFLAVWVNHPLLKHMARGVCGRHAAKIVRGSSSPSTSPRTARLPTWTTSHSIAGRDESRGRGPSPTRLRNRARRNRVKSLPTTSSSNPSTSWRASPPSFRLKSWIARS